VPKNAAYHVVFWLGVGLMAVALALSFLPALPSSARFWIVGVIGLSGWAIASAAKRLKSD
jgi:uncharacterized membrane protein